MSKTLKRWLCRHAMAWSERRQGDVCYRCGHFSVIDRKPPRYGSEVPGFRR